MEHSHSVALKTAKQVTDEYLVFLTNEAHVIGTKRPVGGGSINIGHRSMHVVTIFTMAIEETTLFVENMHQRNLLHPALLVVDENMQYFNYLIIFGIRHKLNCSFSYSLSLL